MLQPCGIDTSLKDHSNRMYLPPRPTLQRIRQGLFLLIQFQPLKQFLHADTANELYNTHDSSIVLKIILTRRPLRVLSLTRRP